MSSGPRAVLVTGPPGSGKSTLGAALAVATGAALLDQDVVTGPLVAVLADLVGAGDDLDHPGLRGPVRDARYAAVLDTAAAQLGAGLDVVLVAPFTREVSGAEAWSALVRRLRSDGARHVDLVWLDCPPDVLLDRLRSRGAARDRARLEPEATAEFVARLRPPAVAALRVEATATVDEQLAAVVGRGCVEQAATTPHPSEQPPATCR